MSGDARCPYFEAGKISLYMTPKNNPSKTKIENVIDQ